MDTNADTNIDTGTYAEVSEVSDQVIKLERNRSYGKVEIIDSSKSSAVVKESSFKQGGYVIAIFVLLLVIVLALAVTSVCVVFALAEISKLKSEAITFSRVEIVAVSVLV